MGCKGSFYNQINDEIFFTDTVNTNNITGLAHFYNLGLKKEADHVVFKINNGPRILLDLNFNKEDINSIGIRKYQNKIDVFYYRKKPLFY